MCRSLNADFLARYDDGETHCLRAFARFLEDREDLSGLRWEYCEDDPPDCWLYASDSLFAVEITSTRVHAGRPGSPEEVPLETWGRGSERLCREIERQAVGRGILSGAFGIAFTAQVSARDSEYRALKKHVIQEALDYFARNQLATQAPTHIVYYGATRVCSIRKFAHSPNQVFYTMTDVSGEKETIRRIAGYISDAMTRKAEGLVRKARDGDWILVLLNTDVFAEKCSHVYYKAFESQSATSRFHSVFLVWGDQTGIMLTSRKPTWRTTRPRDR